MIIDGTPVRRKARKDYEKVVRDLKQARQELDHFETEDKPRFQQWLNQHFGAHLTRLREVSQQLVAKEQLIFEIESEVFLTGVSYGQAYHRVMGRRENPAATENESGEANGSRDGRGPRETSSAGGSNSTDPLEDEMEDFFEDMEGAFEDIFGGPRQEKKRPNREKQPAVKPPVPHLKTLYRALVRRLHPDTQKEMTGQKLEWWHQAQEAYQKGDVEQLEVILSLCEIEERGTTAQTSVSLLVRITRQIASSLRAIRKQLNQCRYDPAWNFGKRTDLRGLSAQTQRHLENSLFELVSALSGIEMQLKRWASEAERGRAKNPRRKRRSRQPECPF